MNDNEPIAWGERREVKNPREGCCHAGVADNSLMITRWYQCSNRIKYDGKWCGTHRDEAVLRRRRQKRERREKWRREFEESSARYEAKARALREHPILFAALTQIAAGHNDPRALARETLERLEKEAK